MKKTMKKLMCAVLAAVGVFGAATMASACTTDHPEVELQIEFNGATYTLEYELNRNIAPATTEHFLWLAGNGYYDGLCVHDYDDTNQRLYTGAYTSATEAEGDLTYKKYYEVISAYGNYGEFPHSVWLDEGRNTPAYTLKGEFESNNFKVTNGAMKESFGSLTMYYHDMTRFQTVAETDVYVVRASEEGKYSKADYQYNSTTSMFYLSLTETEKTNSNYCTFATLHEDSVDALKNLQKAINDYIEENHADAENPFTKKVTKTIFEDEKLLAEYSKQEKTFDTPKAPIVIKKVEVTKY